MKENKNQTEFISYRQLIVHLFSILVGSPYKIVRKVLLALFLTFIMIGLHLLIPVLFKWLVENLSDEKTTSLFWVSSALIGYGICWMMSHVFFVCRSWMLIVLGEDSFRAISLRLVHHLLFLPYSFHIQKKTGSITGDVARLQTAFEGVLWGLFFTIFPTVVEMAVILGIIGAIFGWKCSFALIGLLVVYGVSLFFTGPILDKAQEKYYAKRSITSGKIVDTLLHFETIKAFTNENKDLEKIDLAYFSQGKAGKKRAKLDAFIQLFQMGIIGTVFIIMIWISGQGVHKGSLSIGSFVLINGYLLQLLMPLNYLGYAVSQIRKGVQDIRIGFQIFSSDVEDERKVSEKGRSSPIEIKLEEVHFGYISKKSVLQGVSFTIPAGTKTAIIGPTGSGKSTIARLLLKFYYPDRGAIFIDGKNIHSFSAQQLRKRIGLVSQDTSLFNESLYYNIIYGSDNPSKQEVERAICLSQLGEFIDSLPNGYYTEVGERGLKLSGGEKQRVAIARAILRKPSLYIFDEATSSLDTITEKKIQGDLNAISKENTTLIISHRLTSVIDVDQILVLEGGTIKEKGTHHALLAAEGSYTKYWASQSEKEESIRL